MGRWWLRGSIGSICPRWTGLDGPKIWGVKQIFQSLHKERQRHDFFDCCKRRCWYMLIKDIGWRPVSSNCLGSQAFKFGSASSWVWGVLTILTGGLMRSFPTILMMCAACLDSWGLGMTPSGWWWLEHEFYFSIQLGMSSSQLTHIFQRGRYTTNQP